ncbi:nitrous oxide reductase family maturation protein NosD [Bacillus sp. CGMCC 1.16607]|uniref:nitrous oxide reductase family maturation protein NosD n=1 Tax=Bacillus sp. CGMCC 1.16607 TaxID=3351842 RepID=UPI0036341B4F
MKNIKLFLFIIPFLIWFFPSATEAADRLQEKIDAMKEGDVLKLEGKTYEGNIVIDKPIEIIGTDQTVIKGDGTGNVISIKAPGVKISHLKVTHSSMNRNSPEEFAAIKIHSNGNTIEHIIIRDSFHGIYLSQAHENKIRYVDIKGLGKGEIAGQGNGIHVYYANDNLLEHNTIEGTRDGMFFDYGNGNETIKNSITKTRYALHYMYSDENRFIGNTFTMNTGGAAIMNSKSIELKENHFLFNYGHRSFGILLLSANDITVENNTFYLNQRGLYIDQSTGNTIRKNKIIQNQIGIELWASSNDQVFTENQITENTIPAVALGGQGKNRWSGNGKGNDWGSDFPLPDLNQDRLGDFPVTYRSSLYQLMEDQELTSFFLKSPALKIYEKMNEFLNGDKVMFEDEHPLISSNENENRLGLYGVIGLALLAILYKGRHQLCTIFGRNGKKI